MDVEVILLKDFRLNMVFRTNGTYIAHADDCRFLHHISHLTGQLNLSLTGHAIDFYLQGISSHTGPRKSAHNSNLGCLVRLIQRILFLSQVILQIGSTDSDPRKLFSVFPTFQNPLCSLPADLSQFPLQFPYSGLFRIIGDDIFDRSVLN